MTGGIFDGIEWSTSTVLRATLERFSAAGVEPAALEVLTDVDTVDDLPPGWLEQASIDRDDQPGA
jgi:glycosyltransferase A (GT-A) superfamily protein (DUF2064 family)